MKIHPGWPASIIIRLAQKSQRKRKLRYDKSQQTERATPPAVATALSRA